MANFHLCAVIVLELNHNNIKKKFSGIFFHLTSLLLFLWKSVSEWKGEAETYQDGACHTGMTICRRLSGQIWWLFLQHKIQNEWFFFPHVKKMYASVCVFLIPYLTRHGLGAVTGYNLKGDATSHLPLCGQGRKCVLVLFPLKTHI